MAEQAARILYRGETSEYLEAKRLAARELGTDILPGNLEVAKKLLEVALDIEGEGYWERLMEMRMEALEIMEALEDFGPRLVGSVWRGVVKPNSDIDVELDYEDPQPVTERLRKMGYHPEPPERIDVPEPLREGSLWRIRTLGSKGTPVEIILKEHESYLSPPPCDIYGDPKKGLTLTELREVLERRPRALFTPR